MSTKSLLVLGAAIVVLFLAYFFKGIIFINIAYILASIFAILGIAERVKITKEKGQTYATMAVKIMVGVFILAMIILLVAAFVASTRNN